MKPPLTFKDHFKFGRASGIPTCCSLFFSCLFRFNTNWQSKNPVALYWRYVFKYDVEYIVCPLCVLTGKRVTVIEGSFKKLVLNDNT